MKSNKGKKIILGAAFLLTAAFLAYYVLNNEDAISSIQNITLFQFSVLLLCSILSVSMTGIATKIIANHLNVKMGVNDWLGIHVIGTFLNQIIPLKVGSAFSATYYKRKCGLKYSNFVAMFFGEVILSILATMIMLTSSLFIYSISNRTSLGDDAKIIWLFLAVFFALVIIGFFVLYKFSDRIIKLIPEKWIIYNVLKNFVQMLTKPLLCIKLFMCFFTGNVIQLVRMFLCYYFLGFSINLAGAAVYTSIGGIAAYISILPGNLGLSELLVGIANSVMGTSFEIGVLVALVLRIAGLASVLIGSIIFLVPIYFELKKQKNKKTFEENI